MAFQPSVDDLSAADSTPDDSEPALTPDVWTPRSRYDTICVRLYDFTRSNLSVLFTVVVALVLLAKLSLTMVALLIHPLIAGFALLSVVPALFLALYIWDSDPLSHKNALPLLAAFFLGAVATGFAYLLNTLAVDWFHGFGSLSMAAFFFLWVAPVEEGLKVAAVYVSPVNRRLETALDGAVFGAFVGLGFATAENALYILTDGLLGDGGFQTLIGRAGVAPAHVIWTAIAGYYVGLARENPRYRGALLLKGMLTVILLHGGYNTVVSYMPAAAGVATDRELVTQAGTLIFLLGFYGYIWLKLDHLITRSRDLADSGSTGLRGPPPGRSS